MKSVVLALLVVVAVAVAVGAGFFAYVWFAGGSGEPSTEAVATRVEPAGGETLIYEVDESRSEARFLIDEVLRGEEKTVSGTTDRIAGSVAVDYGAGTIDVGEFVVNMRAIATDDEARDRTIRTLILESAEDEFEFAVFTPVSDTAEFDALAVGEIASFQITGDLTIRDVTRRVTFAMSVALDSEREISGRARTTVRWDDFDITIPYVGGNSIVASVSDVVALEVEFVAVDPSR